MRIRTILAAAAAPAALAAVVLGTAGQASASTGNGNSAAISAYYWQPNGHALGGPQSDPASFTNPSGLALISEKAHGQSISGQTITVNFTANGATGLKNAYSGDSGAIARVWFNGAGGSSDQSPQGYMGQVWWSHVAMKDLTALPDGSYTLTATVNPTSDWTDWNGKPANADAQNQALFTQAASHVQEMGLSFGGNSFFEDGVTGTGSINVTSINVGPAQP